MHFYMYRRVPPLDCIWKNLSTHSAATYNYIRGGTPNSGFYLGTFHMSLVCDIIKMQKVKDQNPLLSVPPILRHCAAYGWLLKM